MPALLSALPPPLIWSCCLLLGLLLVLAILWQPSLLLIGRNDHGRLVISRRALHRLIEHGCEQVQGVAAAHAAVRRRRQLFRTEVRLKVRPNAKLDAIQGYLTQEIAAIYRDNLGQKEIGPIDIKVTGVTSEEAGF